MLCPGAFGVHLGKFRVALNGAQMCSDAYGPAPDSRKSTRSVCVAGAVGLRCTYLPPSLYSLFMIRNYWPEDDIFLFGFSRVRVLKKQLFEMIDVHNAC